MSDDVLERFEWLQESLYGDILEYPITFQHDVKAVFDDVRARLESVESLQAEADRCKKTDQYEMVDALDHIFRVARAGRKQTRRDRWIAQRALSALDNNEDWRDVDYPKMEGSEKAINGLMKRNRALTQQVADLEAEVERLHEVWARTEPDGYGYHCPTEMPETVAQKLYRVVPQQDQEEA